MIGFLVVCALTVVSMIRSEKDLFTNGMTGVEPKGSPEVEIEGSGTGVGVKEGPSKGPFRLPLSLDPEISETSDAGMLPWRVCNLAGEWETTPSPEPPPSDPNKVNLPIEQAIKEDADSSACFGGFTKVMRGVENVVFLGDR